MKEVIAMDMNAAGVLIEKEKKPEGTAKRLAGYALKIAKKGKEKEHA
jgi:hypothetical protein